MNRLCLAILATLLLTLFALPVQAEPPLAWSLPDTAPAYQWRELDGDDTQAALYQWTAGGWYQVGGYRFESSTYHPRYQPGVWGHPCPCPIAPPEGLRRRWRRRHPPRPRLNFGLEESKMPQIGAGAQYRDQNGKMLKPEEALKKLGKPTPTKPTTRPRTAIPGIPDDGRKPFFVVVGSPAETGRVLAELEATGKASEFRTQTYDPAGDPLTNWPAQRGRFPAGKPTIVLEDARGQVISTTLMDPGPAGVKRLVEAALGKWEPDPHYDPKKDDDLSKPAVAGKPVDDNTVHYVAGGLGATALLVAGLSLVLRRKPA